VEEQFYLLWPLAITLFVKTSNRAQFGIVISFIAVSLVLAELLLYLQPDAAFYEMPARFWELSAGSLVAFTAKKNLPAAVRRVLLGVAAILILAGLAVPIFHFPGIGAIPAVAGAATLILIIHRSNEPVSSLAVLRSKPLVGIGLVSYPLYLWHWPLLVFADANEQPFTIRAVVCLAAALLAVLTYRFVELPSRSFIAAFANRKIVMRAFGLSLLAAASLVCVGQTFEKMHPVDFATRTRADYPTNRTTCHFRGDDPPDVVPRPACVSVRGKPVRVVIWGDSHALAWEPFAWTIARKQGAAATSLTRDACSPILDYRNGKRALEEQRCEQFNNRAFDWIIKNGESIDVLIVTASWPTDISAGGFWDKFQRTLESVAPRVGRVVILGPTPYMPKSVPDCIARNETATCVESRDAFDESAAQIKTALTKLAASLHNVQYVDLTDFFCDQKICPAIRDGYGLYWDTNHVSTTAATKFSQQFLIDGSLDVDQGRN
jgi:hypothetical protein